MEPKTEPKIVVENVEKKYARGGGVGPISFEVDRGDFVAILGGSGTGKSTLLRLLGGVEEKTSGNIRFPDTCDLATWGFVFQDAALLPWKNALENVLLPQRLRMMPKGPMLKHALDLLTQLGLEGARGLYPHELSGGMKMRVSLARALLDEPRWLALDEPFSALDEPVRWALAEDLRTLWLKSRPTVFFVTHSILEALTLATRVLVIDGSPGKIVLDRRLPWPADRTFEVRGDPEFIRLTQQIYDLVAGKRRK